MGCDEVEEVGRARSHRVLWWGIWVLVQGQQEVLAGFKHDLGNVSFPKAYIVSLIFCSPNSGLTSNNNNSRFHPTFIHHKFQYYPTL